jgi:hypothetical protein
MYIRWNDQTSLRSHCHHRHKQAHTGCSIICDYTYYYRFFHPHASRPILANCTIDELGDLEMLLGGCEVWMGKWISELKDSIVFQGNVKNLRARQSVRTIAQDSFKIGIGWNSTRRVHTLLDRHFFEARAIFAPSLHSHLHCFHQTK